MFPERDAPVDCTRRSGARACAIGWVRGDVRTAIFG